MAVSRNKALGYAEKLLSIPRARLEVKLRQGKTAVVLSHRGRTLTKCYINRSGLEAAFYTARALGVSVPPLGSSVGAQVSTGVLWRAISISCLNFARRESYELLERLLSEAETMRASGGEGV